MIERLFQHRSGRVIALCRAVLALVFFLALWVDPDQPVRYSLLGYAILGGYLALAAVLLAIAFNSWWLDHRLAWPSLVVDILAFLAAVYFTEGQHDDFTSPFLAFFAYVMLAATIRWDWRVTGLVGVIVTVCYLVVGTGLSVAGVEFDILRFGRRVIYMAVLALILMWFGLQRRDQHIDRMIDRGESSDQPDMPLDACLDYAIEQSGAAAGAIVWCDFEEPDCAIRTRGVDEPRAPLRCDAILAPNAFGTTARLVSRDRKRSLRAVPRTRPLAMRGRFEEALANAFAFRDVLILPIATSSGRGDILLSAIPGVCTDHVRIGTLIAREVEGAFARHASLLLTQESELARARNSLARDLHDSVAQSLAGAAMRLEGLRQWIRAGEDPEPEIDQLKQALRTEQAHVRGLIERLRDPSPLPDRGDLGAGIARLAGDLARNWNIAITCNAAPALVTRMSLVHELSNIVREAVANAVRHGTAQQVEIAVARTASGIAMAIGDNGKGFADAAGAQAPRSIRERVDRLGGTLSVESGPGGTTLVLTVPQGERA